MSGESWTPDVGDLVRYHPIIGREHDGRVYRVESIGNLGHGQTVAWLEGKVGCVALEALSLAEQEPMTAERPAGADFDDGFLHAPGCGQGPACLWCGIERVIRNELGPASLIHVRAALREAFERGVAKADKALTPREAALLLEAGEHRAARRIRDELHKWAWALDGDFERNEPHYIIIRLYPGAFPEEGR